MKPNKREESSESHIQLNTVLLRTGMIWKRSGITLSTLNWESPQMSTQFCSLKPHWTPRLTERRWPKSCSRHSMYHPSTFPSKPYYLFTQLVEPLVLCAIQVMVLPTLFPFMKVSPSLMPSTESNWLVVILLNSWLSSSLKEATTLSPQLNWKSSETSRRSAALSLSTTKLPWNRLKTHQVSRRPTNYQTVRSSPLEMPDSDAQSSSSSHSKWTEKNTTPSKIWPITVSKSAMSMLEENSTRTLFFQEVPPCLKASVKDSSRKLNQEHQSPSMLKSLLPQIEDSPSGEEVPPSLLYPHSHQCGSPRRTMTSTVQPSSTENVFERPLISYEHE